MTDDRPMTIVDAQIHDPEPRRDLDVAGLRVEASADLAIAALDAVGVAGALVNSSLPIITAFCARYPERFAGVPFLSDDSADRPPDDYFAALSERTDVVGVRILFTHADRLEQLRALGGLRPAFEHIRGLSLEALDSGDDFELFEAAAKHRVPVFVNAPGRVAALAPILAALPGLTLIIDNLGLPSPAVPASLRPLAGLADLIEIARFPNATLKFSGVPALARERYPFADVWPAVRPVIDAFGADRVMWGSDFTRCQQSHSYREGVDFVIHSPALTQHERTQILGSSLASIVGWSPGPRPNG